MEENSRSQSMENAEAQNQQPEDIRQGYAIRMSGGNKVIFPTAFGAVDLPLAHMHQPDFSTAVNMAVGVSVIADRGWTI